MGPETKQFAVSDIRNAEEHAMSICYHDTPRRRWYEAYHLQRLLRRQRHEDRVFKAHFWQLALPACALFWVAVAFGIHSL
jgi:hypothetical protein